MIDDDFVGNNKPPLTFPFFTSPHSKFGCGAVRMMTANLWRISFFIALSLLLIHAVYGKVKRVLSSVVIWVVTSFVIIAPWFLLQRV
jgi:hypothetical protein